MPSFRVNRSAVAAVIVAAVGSLGATVVHAQANSIFPAGWDSKIRDRMFMRIGYTSAFTKTKSEDARDITGPVMTRAETDAAFATAIQISQACGTNKSTGDCARYNDYDGADVAQNGNVWLLAQGVLNGAFDSSGTDSIGTPTGIKAKAQKQAGTPTVSIGYWLDEDRKWMIEGFVLAQPMSIKIEGDGKRSDGTPNGVNGQHLATTKLLPPLVIGSYHFGSKESIVRPYLGVGAMYAVFFGAKTTPFFDAYQGGKTTISTKNTFGAGPFVGLQSSINEDWHVNVSVGQIGLRAKSRLVTTNTFIATGSGVLKDLHPDIVEAVNVGDDFTPAADGGLEIPNNIGSGTVGVTTLLSELVSRQRGSNNLGTYVREQKMKINNTIVTVSIGRSF